MIPPIFFLCCKRSKAYQSPFCDSLHEVDRTGGGRELMNASELAKKRYWIDNSVMFVFPS